MADEIEAKIKVRDFRAILKALRKAGAEFLGTAVETDQFFDTRGGDLRRRDCGLRLRTIRMLRRGAEPPPPGALLTYKGPKKRPRGLKIRREVQTYVRDAGILASIFEALGFVPTVMVRKRRRSFVLAKPGRCRVELDELPGLGRFVEVEGPSEKAVKEACRALGLEGEPITRSYVSMVANIRVRAKD
ncbi:MAG: class IV adenylate cyclase [Phycisphaerae bacterium]